MISYVILSISLVFGILIIALKYMINQNRKAEALRKELEEEAEAARMIDENRIRREISIKTAKIKANIQNKREQAEIDAGHRDHFDKDSF